MVVVAAVRALDSSEVGSKTAGVVVVVGAAVPVVGSVTVLVVVVVADGAKAPAVE